ncbi:MAG: preprotein translocase subunit SecE [Alcanivoracaceae bacterium]|jgi:preprotein translocase subunit SecE|nr:preprotein translocase subunit SecE [Alcanivoracaceae bacterium]
MSENAEQQSSASALDMIKWAVVVALVVAAVWGNSYYADQSVLYRALAILGLAVVAGFVALQTEQGRAFNQLRKDATVEMRKVTWPTRQETLQTTVVVLIFVVVIALIMAVIDWMLGGIITWAIG